MELTPTPIVTGGVIVSTKQYSARSSSSSCSTISTELISKLETILHKERGAYYNDSRTRGKIFGILEPSNQ